MDSGWIKIYRKIESSRPFSRGLEYLGAMVWLVLKARHEDGFFQGVECKRGQLFTGRKQLAEAWNVSEKKVRMILDQLESDSFLVRKGASKGTMITVCNYDTYQSKENEDGQQRANKGPTKGQQRATNNNERNNNHTACARTRIPTTPAEAIEMAANAGRVMNQMQAKMYLAKRGREEWKLPDGRNIPSIPHDIVYFLLRWNQNEADKAKAGRPSPPPVQTPTSAPVGKFENKDLN